MRTIQVRYAKARFSELVAAAERGEPTTITRHGQPAAVVVPVAMAKTLYPDQKRSFAEVLLDYPGGVEFERDTTPMRDIDL